jgi:hypothetical protein
MTRVLLVSCLLAVCLLGTAGPASAQQPVRWHGTVSWTHTLDAEVAGYSRTKITDGGTFRMPASGPTTLEYAYEGRYSYDSGPLLPGGGCGWVENAQVVTGSANGLAVPDLVVRESGLGPEDGYYVEWNEGFHHSGTESTRSCVLGVIYGNTQPGSWFANWGWSNVYKSTDGGKSFSGSGPCPGTPAAGESCTETVQMTRVEVAECDDGDDNDDDGRTDHPADPGCDSPTDDSEAPDPECGDLADNDGDGRIDYPADPGCDSATDDSESPDPQCADENDNDRDGRNNYPADPGCASPEDDSEAPDPACGDRDNNDKDGLVDLADPGCTDARDTSEYDEVSLTVDVQGPGWANGCRETCVSKVERGIDAFVDAVPDEPNDGFLRFEGCGAFGLRCAVTMDGDHTVRAVFDPIVTYAPWVRFHTKEKHWPMDPGKFVKRSSLKWHNHQIDRITGACTKKDKEIAGRGEVRPAWLANGRYKHSYCWREPDPGGFEPDDQHRKFRSNELTSPSFKNKPGRGDILGRSGFFLNLADSQHEGVKPVGGKAPPLYVEYEPGRYIIYWFFSAKNHSDVGPKGRKVRDRHEGDWEHIAVHLDGRDRMWTERVGGIADRTESVAYWAHYCGPTSYPWSFMEQNGWHVGTHPTVWVALGSHASYPDKGKDLVAGECSSPFKGVWDKRNEGHIWQTWERGRAGFLEADKQPWYGFGGGWGHLADSTKHWPGPFWGPLGPGPLKMKEALPEGW